MKLSTVALYSNDFIIITCIIIFLLHHISVISCGNPGLPLYASISQSTWLYGDTVVYTCDIGYKHTSGDMERTCQEDGQWSGTFPNCTGRIVWVESWLTINSGKYVILIQLFFLWYFLWWFFSAISCGDPGEIANAKRILSGEFYNDIVVYTCDTGYNQTSGDMERTCQEDGHWSGSLPTCQGNKNYESVPCSLIDNIWVYLTVLFIWHCQFIFSLFVIYFYFNSAWNNNSRYADTCVFILMVKSLHSYSL